MSYGEGWRLSALTANLEIFASIAVLGLGLILSVVSLLSYQRLRHPRALFIGLGFLVFGVKGGFLAQWSASTGGSIPGLLVVAGLDLVILTLLYLALRLR